MVDLSSLLKSDRALAAIKYEKSAWQAWVEDMDGWKAIALFLMFVFALCIVVCATI